MTPTCASCGAPDSGEFVICKFCQQAVSAEAQRTAIPCTNPQCRTLNRWGKQNCASCKSWIVVSCVFCSSISPHNVPACLRCNEVFAGAAQRKAQIEAQRQQQVQAQQVNQWGGLAASFLGAAAGVAVSSSWSSDDDYSSSSETFDISGLTDDTSFDFGGDD